MAGLKKWAQRYEGFLGSLLYVAFIVMVFTVAGWFDRKSSEIDGGSYTVRCERIQPQQFQCLVTP